MTVFLVLAAVTILGLCLIGVQSQEVHDDLYCPVKWELLHPEDGELTITCVNNDSKNGTCNFRNMGAPINTDVVEFVSLDGSAEECSEEDTPGEEGAKEKCLYLGAGGNSGSVTLTCSDPNGCQYICCSKNDPNELFECSLSGPAAPGSTNEAVADAVSPNTSGSSLESSSLTVVNVRGVLLVAVLATILIGH